MNKPRDWKLLFTCPACDRAGEVAAVNLTAVVHCPYCRTKVVIDKDGMHKARKHARRRRSIRQVKTQVNCGGKVHHRSGDLRLLWTGVVSTVITAGMVALHSWSREQASDDERALLSAVELFQSAWLDGDLEAAAALVSGNDRDHLPKWSAPRHAALVAGFGSDYRAHVTRIEVLHLDSQNAVVRVVFEIRGRKQQAIQNWVLDEGHWKFTFEPAGS